MLEGYDGARVMSGYLNGVQPRIAKRYPKAMCAHCGSHKLNLAITHALSVRIMRYSFDIMEEVTRFFRKNANATQLLKDAIVLYARDSKRTCLIQIRGTRFIERHDSVNVFLELLECICRVLLEISQDKRKPASSKTTSHLALIERSEFIFSLFVSEKLLSYTLPLSILLLLKTLGLISAINHVKEAITALKDI